MGPVPVMRGPLARPRATVQVEDVTGGEPSRLSISTIWDPTVSRPPHYPPKPTHREPASDSAKPPCKELRALLLGPGSCSHARCARDDSGPRAFPVKAAPAAIHASLRIRDAAVRAPSLKRVVGAR